MAMISAIVGPVTSGPTPVANAASVATTRSPSIRPLANTVMSVPA